MEIKGNKKLDKKKLNHMIKVIPERYWAYKCNFCGKLFERCSECAKHIEKESFAKLCFPSDILITDLRSETRLKRRLAKGKRI